MLQERIPKMLTNTISNWKFFMIIILVSFYHQIRELQLLSLFTFMQIRKTDFISLDFRNVVCIRMKMCYDTPKLYELGPTWLFFRPVGLCNINHNALHFLFLLKVCRVLLFFRKLYHCTVIITNESWHFHFDSITQFKTNLKSYFYKIIIIIIIVRTETYLIP